jgi:hypothetical protein
MPRNLIKAALLDHTVDNEHLADALINALVMEVVRESAAVLRERGYVEAAEVLDPGITGVHSDGGR